MSQPRYININYPFRNSPDGFFLDLTSTDESAVKSDLLHLLLTNKGQRLYKPDFGTDLLKYIFEQSDEQTFSNIKTNIKETVKKYIPNLVVDDIKVEWIDGDEHKAIVTIDYTITEDVFEVTDSIKITI